MTTTIKGKQERLHQWASFIGRKAIVESTNYYDFGGEKPMIELQRNILEDASERNGEISLRFKSGDRTNGYGNLGCIYERSVHKSHFTPEAVREYTKKKLLKDERMKDIAPNKTELAVGQKFMVFHSHPTSGGFSINITKIKDYTLAKGVQFSGYNRIPDSLLFSVSEFDKLLDEVESFCSIALSIPISKKEETPLEAPALDLNRYSVCTAYIDKNGKRIDQLTTFAESDMKSIEDVFRFLKQTYENTRVVSVVTDIVENTVHHWKSNSKND